MTKFSFEELKAYKMGRLLVKEVYQIQSNFPKEEVFGLGSQIRRAAVSITANLAEGSGRMSLKEKQQYVAVAYGSLTELFSEILTASDLGYITEEEVDELRPLFIDMSKMLSGMRQSLQKRMATTAETATAN